MLPKGKGFISYSDLKELFGLPQVNTEIVNVEMVDGGIEFHIISKEPIKGKTYVANGFNELRRFRTKFDEELTEEFVQILAEMIKAFCEEYSKDRTVDGK